MNDMKKVPDLSELTLDFHNGQLFMRWQEADLPDNARLRVWRSREKITVDNLAGAELLADMLNPGSARDWWRDPASFVVPRDETLKSEEIFAGNVADTGTSPQLAKGWVLKDDAPPISPAGGLHVHTPESGGTFYYAVSWHSGEAEKAEFLLTADEPVTVAPGKAEIIRIAGNTGRSGTAGLPMIVYLHGREGGIGVDKNGEPCGTHLLFTDTSLAWREGIPVKFAVEVTDTFDGRKASEKFVKLTLFDRIWIGRPLTDKESNDPRDHVPAVNTFWMGYHTDIARGCFAPYFWDNYTEKLVMYIIDLVQEKFATDPNRLYLAGGSMGGTGAVHLSMHFPNRFAAALAWVPVYRYSWAETAGFPQLAPSIERMRCTVGLFSPDDPVISPDGRELRKYGDAVRFISDPTVDMPPLFATNGRRDMSIPWVNNPPFFTAAEKAQQALRVIWNNGGHGMTGEVEEVVTPDELLSYRLDKPFAAFSNNSDNCDYGSGDPADGDLYGWLNRGLAVGTVEESDKTVMVELSAGHAEMDFPVTCDVTIRRRKLFKPVPGTHLQCRVDGAEVPDCIVNENGLLTVKNITFSKPGKITLFLSQR